MKKVIILAITLILSGCASYKIAPIDDELRKVGGSQELGSVEVTQMQGWVTLFMISLPDWNFGVGTEEKIQQGVRVLTKVAD